MSDLKPLIAAIVGGRPLTEKEAEQAFDILMSGDATPAQIGGFLMGLRVRGETVPEICATVLTQEPPREPNPLLAPDVPNLIVTPHMAWASAGAMQRLADSAIANVDAFLRGTPVNRVA